ncbi:hypothetical protein SYJ56_19765, partial [Algoriphagus sp. D3-2-R+10]|uniref:hypothetical protein n=1 Tax=Algoriphagus aurantiacus TaxID=3103948 RepID=UPI002B3BB253
LPLTEQGIVRFVACLFHPATLYIQDSTINMVLSDAYIYSYRVVSHLPDKFDFYQGIFYKR